MICPICNQEVVFDEVIEEHHHRVGSYMVYYDVDLSVITDVWYHAPIHGGRVLSLEGWVWLDEKRIERLLLLK